MQAQHRQHWDHCVTQRMAVDDRAFGQAFGAGGADVVLAELFEHRRAHHARENGSERAAHGDCGQNEIGERSGSGDGQPSKFNREDQDENGAEREVGER